MSNPFFWLPTVDDPIVKLLLPNATPEHLENLRRYPMNFELNAIIKSAQELDSASEDNAFFRMVDRITGETPWLAP